MQDIFQKKKISIHSFINNCQFPAILRTVARYLRHDILSPRVCILKLSDDSETFLAVSVKMNFRAKLSVFYGYLRWTWSRIIFFALWKGNFYKKKKKISNQPLKLGEARSSGSALNLFESNHLKYLQNVLHPNNKSEMSFKSFHQNDFSNGRQ